MIWLDRLRGRLRLLSTSRYTRARVEEEFRFHIEMETERMVRDWGLAPETALRRARESFGDQDALRAELRVGRGRGWPHGGAPVPAMPSAFPSLPDFAMVGGLGAALVVAFCASTFSVTYGLFHLIAPIEESDRVIALESWDPTFETQDRQALADFARWRDELESVTEISAFRNVEAEVMAGGGAPVLTNVAAMTASGFEVARARALIGRHLSEADERRDAAPVVVIGYEVWATRFARDASILGRTVRIGGTDRTVVGVMPEGFGFPIRYGFWIPLDPATEDDPFVEIFVFGRLVPGATLESARAEIARLGARGDLQAQAVPLQAFLSNILDATVRAAWGTTLGRVLGQLALQALAMATVSAFLALSASAAWSRSSRLRIRKLDVLAAD